MRETGQALSAAALVILSLTLLTLPKAASSRRRPLSLPAQSNTDSPLLDSLLRADPQLAPIIKRANEHEVQIIYTQIHRDEQNQPHFTQHNFHLNARQYFNPASLVKLPVAALALEKLNQLHQPGLNLNNSLSIGAAFRCQTPVPYVVPSDSDQLNTIGNYIKRMLLVSDNSAYNRLYEFLGQRFLNERLWSLGYPTVRIVRRFAPCDAAANRYTNPFIFYNQQGEPIYKQPAAINTYPLGFPLGRITKGNGYQAGGQIVKKSYDFTTANYLPLQQATDLLKAILFPEQAPRNQQMNLTTVDYAFLRRYLYKTPHASNISLYTSNKYHDAYKKYLYYGRSPKARSHPSLRIYNVVGMSHGYLADVAYFADATQQTEFLLSAVIYVNKDGIINDGAYEYESVGLPFLARLGQIIYQYEVAKNYIKRPQLHNTFSKD
ncbi:serine hydrolase [Hymenobacter elongatus]|nr:serine hydrolase [Hymenobacter elongatus]